MNIDTSLLREKFVIKEKNAAPEGKALEIICPSTRMPINLQAGELPPETFIVRSNNMHSCTRLVAQIIRHYESGGPIMSRQIKLDWTELWDNTLNSYERTYNQNRWACVYHKGKQIFSIGKHHPFLDVVEQCDVLNKGDYEKSLKLAEDAFHQAGKDIDMNYDSNVALVAILNRNNGRGSMVLRGPERITTFNYSLTPLKNEKINVPQGLSTASDFLEGVQLSYMVGLSLEKLKKGVIEKYSDEDKQIDAARKRVGELEAQISSMENRYKIRYRPERPDFEDIITQTELFARRNPSKDGYDIHG